MRLRAGALLLAAATLVAACGGDKKVAKPVPPTTSSSTTTAVGPTALAPATGAVAPLTGLPTPAEQASLLLRPALALKIDNAVEAMPQEGLNAADVVFEIKVEGISRLMAVFQSHDANEVGPTRSARYSDPNILALLGKPLFGWSGANDGVVASVSKSSWIVNVNWDRVKNTDYYRRSGRPAPHNLYTRTATLFGYAQPGQPPARPLFTYASAATPNTNLATPVGGMTLTVGDTPSQWVWDAASSAWLRWQYGRRDNDEAGGQVAATNVVILDTRYGGGSVTPTALTTGSGRAVVLSGGAMIEGTWSRATVPDPYAIVGKDGQPIRITPGRTWVELTPGPTSRVMTAETASGLLSSGR